MSEKQMRLGTLEAGGTKMVCAVVSGDGEVLDRMETPTTSATAPSSRRPSSRGEAMVFAPRSPTPSGFRWPTTRT